MTKDHEIESSDIINDDPNSELATEATIQDLIEARTESEQILEEDWRDKNAHLRALNLLVRSFYQIQKQRLMMGNRLFAYCAKSLGIKPGTSKDSNKMASKILNELLVEHKDITTAIAKKLIGEETIDAYKSKYNIDIRQIIAENPSYMRVDLGLLNKTKTLAEMSEIEPCLAIESVFKDRKLIQTRTDYVLANQWVKLKNMETEIQKDFAKIVEKFQIWTGFLKQVRGIGPTLAACLISMINMEKCYTVQSLWKYCGLDVVVVDGIGVGRNSHKECMEEREYVDADGNIKTKMSLTYNPWLKSKLMGTLSGMLMLQNPVYKGIYSEIRQRYESSDRMSMMRPKIKNGIPVIDKKTGEPSMIPMYPLARINMMSQRYMVKMFLLDLWVHNRIFMGLPLKTPYAMAKLNYQAKFRTFINDSTGTKQLTRVAFDPRLNLEMLKEIERGPISKYVL